MFAQLQKTAIVLYLLGTDDQHNFERCVNGAVMSLADLYICKSLFFFQ